MERITRLLVAALVAQLDGRKIAPPEAGLIIWRAFLDLTRTRTWQQHGPCPIAYHEIEAWCRANRTPLSGRHIAAIREMDDAYISDAQAKLLIRKTDGTSGSTLTGLSKQPLSTELFDAMFGGQ